MDLREAFNTISDVVQNRPLPLREFDQIYMKVGDMVIQAEFIARKFEEKSVVFIGDGDGISLSVMHLKNTGVFKSGPKSILVLDFDERIVNAINAFAMSHEMSHLISARLYNVADPLPDDVISSNDVFYTNPPWGASNDGESVNVFVQRGIEATNESSTGVIVIADDAELVWAKQVLRNVQLSAIKNGYFVSEMIPELHNYHLDDTPDLKSCSLIIKRLEPINLPVKSRAITTDQQNHFYGKNNPLKIRYIRDQSGLAPNTAFPKSYSMEEFPSESDY